MAKHFKDSEKKERDAHLKSEVGLRLRALRLAWGKKSQGAFAKEIGTHQATYSRWEKGVDFPDPVALVEICAIRRVHFNFIYTGDFKGLDGDVAAPLALYLASEGTPER